MGAEEEAEPRGGQGQALIVCVCVCMCVCVCKHIIISEKIPGKLLVVSKLLKIRLEMGRREGEA